MLCLSRKILYTPSRKRGTERERMFVWLRHCAGYRYPASSRLGFLCKPYWREKAEKSHCSLGQSWTQLYNWPLSGLYSLQWPQLCCVGLVTNEQNETKLPFWTVMLTYSGDVPFKLSLHVCLQIPVYLVPLLKKRLSLTTYLSFKQSKTFFTIFKLAIQPL